MPVEIDIAQETFITLGSVTFPGMEIDLIHAEVEIDGEPVVAPAGPYLTPQGTVG